MKKKIKNFEIALTKLKQGDWVHLHRTQVDCYAANDFAIDSNSYGWYQVESNHSREKNIIINTHIGTRTIAYKDILKTRGVTCYETTEEDKAKFRQSIENAQNEIEKEEEQRKIACKFCKAVKSDTKDIIINFGSKVVNGEIVNAAFSVRLCGECAQDLLQDAILNFIPSSNITEFYSKILDNSWCGRVTSYNAEAAFEKRNKLYSMFANRKHMRRQRRRKNERTKN
ncbi:MAG: hypothetical protein WDA06_15960 [Phenylobacterium sp.]